MELLTPGRRRRALVLPASHRRRRADRCRTPSGCACPCAGAAIRRRGRWYGRGRPCSSWTSRGSRTGSRGRQGRGEAGRGAARGRAGAARGTGEVRWGALRGPGHPGGEAGIGPHRARPAPPCGVEVRRPVAPEYRAAREEGVGPALAIRGATGRCRRGSLRPITRGGGRPGPGPRHAARRTAARRGRFTAWPACG
ncbi:DUF6214 family protein [Streptomyces sp. NPDC006527]|uniref:DUF6214 family protein n=1 Tax=Streptomyces sp. NPDC006527 TaxID=3364749 RepID=UPI00369DDBF5